MTQQPNQLDLVPTPSPRLAPTQETYNELQMAYDHFNERLFGGQLPSCLITLQREKRTFGYFSAARFASLDGSTTDEIAMNPTYFAVVPIIETLQTQVHEMTHLWQHHFGKPGRGRYHNEEWARKMESIGLMPSSTGQPGGARTGDSMADYAVEGGRFLAACDELLTANFTLSWYDRFPSADHVIAGQASMANHIQGIEGTKPPMASIPALAEAVKPTGLAVAATAGEDGVLTTPANRSNRVKYSCSGCKNPVSVWGKPGIKLICGECRKSFDVQ
ncbi:MULTISPECIES: SprT-like domain-containing protein [Comamonas]|jgi:predicted SprT family Zn-dependent metalloprotease|uniref:SprT-like family n=4 Tax=Comamonas TaxID=283 RepID=A0A5A7MH13_COMTE|nr:MULTISPECIES: SprT-like domain-containing protein [Comamonas]MDN5504786.1 SprT-like domain-containing protein [Comamonas sp.]EED67467.1 zinc metalloproteinase Mpr protein [Comamonas testosteroni KF-1]EFI58696.1 zinc metalloproteinase Mpr protein [Comamonas thiooxydans]EHN67244.1 zinc metalloproteinase Mpr protein [Comamonas testosteroni ATCC 11996]KGG83686.1 zinc metalloprotease [Comamonas thiooxydans]